VAQGIIFRFRTNASPDEVYKFYKDTLLNEGWFQPIDQPTSGAITFEWGRASVNEGTTKSAYSLTVFASANSTGPTIVETNFKEFDPLKE